MEDEIGTALREWVRLFNQGDYFQAHEVLEHPWLHASGPDKTFLKGLIHAAVALYQYRRGNGHGARVKYQSCARYLSPFVPYHSGIEVEDLLRQMEAFFRDLLSQSPGTPPPPPRHPWPQVRELS
jgi:uncharacterized protein